MCKWGTTVIMELTLPARLSHTGQDYTKLVDVDECIAKIVRSLNNAGVYTIASCCGHGKQPGRISLRDGRELLITDFDGATKFEQLFPGIN